MAKHFMGRNHWSRFAGLTLSSIERTASPQSSIMILSTTRSVEKIKQSHHVGGLFPLFINSRIRGAPKVPYGVRAQRDDPMAGGLSINRASHRQDEKPGDAKVPKIRAVFFAAGSGSLPEATLACLGCAQTVCDC
jgi:hypothetical protein